jgi:hypothetical protein
MKYDDITYKIVLENKEVTFNNLKKWFSKMLYFEPTEIMGEKISKGGSIKYNDNLFIKKIESLIHEERFTVRILDDELNIISFSRGREYSTIICSLSHKNYRENEEEVLSTIDSLFLDHDCVVAYICSSVDNLWQNNADIQSYKSHGKSIESLKLKQHRKIKNRQIVDIEFNPGHFHIVKELWFGSCWRMWFGAQYFKYIPKEVLINFKGGYQTLELEDGSVRITLYESIWDYEKPENRVIQWNFRRQVGIDEVAHQLEGEPFLKETPDPAIEIFTEDLQHGGVRGIKYYYNDEKEVVPKSRATEVHYYEFDQSGEVVWSEVKKL